MEKTLKLTEILLFYMNIGFRQIEDSSFMLLLIIIQFFS